MGPLSPGFCRGCWVSFQTQSLRLKKDSRQVGRPEIAIVQNQCSKRRAGGREFKASLSYEINRQADACVCMCVTGLNDG